MGLEAEPTTVQSDSGEVWTTGDRSVCLLVINTVPTLFSWRPDLEVEATDAFKQIWTGPSYANPPFAIIPRVLSQVKSQRANLVLIAPVWKSQAWYPVLLDLLVDCPGLLPAEELTILQMHTIPLPIQGHKVQLALWPISGDHVRLNSFQGRLQSSSLLDRTQSPKVTTTWSFSSGSAGVRNRIEIPFMDM